MFPSTVTIRRPGLVSAVTALLPTGVFLLADLWFGLAPAMLITSVATVILVLVRRRSGQGIGILLPLSLTYVVVKAVAGILTQSQVVYFGSGIALSALIAILVGATAFTGRPVAVHLMPLVTPYRHLTAEYPVYRRVAAHVTIAWALAELGIAVWEGWHLAAASASEFLILRSLVGWPAMGVLIFGLIFYIRFRLDRIERALAREPRERRSPVEA